MDPLRQIKHVVVLMLENRSFDHMLGALPGVDGIDGANYNSQRPLVPPDGANPAHGQSPIRIGFEPARFNPRHDFADMMKQMFGPQATGFVRGRTLPFPLAPTYPEQQCGYVADWGSAEVMNYFAAGQLQVLHSLAGQFCICDNWFCDVPTCTVPNRLFMHSGTSEGILAGALPRPPLGAKTIFEQIDRHRSGNPADKWGIYYFPPDLCDGDFFRYTLSEPRAHQSVANDFFGQLATGRLPFYSFLMPILNSAPETQCNSMHPPADVRYGENYVAMVYNVLLQSPAWKNTLLIVNFDENGGIYDHRWPPGTVAPDSPAYIPFPTPDGSFDFTSLGPRVPSLLISPWLRAGSVDHTPYQNTSILRFLQDALAPSRPLPGVKLSLTNRDRQANSIARAFSQFGLPAPRTDCRPVPVIPGHVWNTQGGRAAAGEAVPAPYQIELTLDYASVLPGHPDSGKAIGRGFPTGAALHSYTAERLEAARRYYAAAD